MVVIFHPEILHPRVAGHTLPRLSEFTPGWKRCVQSSTGERVKNKQLECGTSKIFRLLSLFLFWQDGTQKTPKAGMCQPFQEQGEITSNCLSFLKQESCESFQADSSV